MTENFKQNGQEAKSGAEFQFDLRSLQNQSKKELIQLAKDLSKGCFEKNSEQRRQILQMIADKLAETPDDPP